MLMAMIRLLRRSLGLLLCLAPGFGAAQSNGDSTFNAIDYYSGRIARGYGGKYEQTWLKDGEGNQRFITTPSLYGSLSPRVGIQISHELSWPWESTIIDSFPDGVRKTNLIKAKTSRMQLQLRPMRELQIFLSTTLSRADQKFAIEALPPSVLKSVSAGEIDGEQFHVSGLYFSHHGTLTLKPVQIGWIYYGNTNSPFLQSLFSSPIRFVEKGQKLAAFSIELTSSRSKAENNAQNLLSTIQSRAESEARTSPLNLNYLHGLKDNLMVGFVLEASRQTNSNESQNIVDASDLSRSQSSIDTWQWRVGPSVEFLTSDNALQRFMFYYRRLRWKGNGDNLSTRPDTVFKSVFDATNIDKSWMFGYAFHRFWNAPPPSLQAYLADWNHDFGNRLPAGGFHFRAEFFVGGGKSDHESVSFYSQPRGEQNRSEAEFRSMQAHVMAGYSAFDWLELAWKIQLERTWQGSIGLERNHEPIPGFQERWGNSMTWQNKFVVNFANYRYNERLHSRFGWYTTSAFDQLYGALLLPGMINGAISWQPDYLFAEPWITNDLEYFSFRFPDQWSKRNWLLQTQLRIGLIANLQLAAAGVFSREGQSRPAPGSRVEDSINATISWQPWSSVRLELFHHFDLEDGDGQARNDFWNFRLLTLF
jgi:hypothetical protein